MGQDLATYLEPDVQFCTVGGVDHDYRPHTEPVSYASLMGRKPRTYWRCVWCHGVTCGDYGEPDPCWRPYHHPTPHRSRAGVVWGLGENRPDTPGGSA